MEYDIDSDDSDDNSEVKNEEKKNNTEKVQEEKEEKDYNSDEDEQFNDDKFMKSMKEGKYRDKHFHRFSKHHDGVEFTAFDLREENEEGHFDENMNYIPNKEKFDPWYESVKEEIRQKELLKHKRKKITEISDSDSQNEDDKDEEYSKYGDEDLYYKEEKITKEESDQINKEIKINRIKLIPLLKDEKENVKQALQRLKNKNKKNDKKLNKKNKEIKNDKNIDINKDDKFNNLLGIVSKLTELSYFDVYSDTIFKIAKDYGVENIFLWKYKIIEKDKDNKDNKETVYGDYDTLTMKEWVKQKYFESNEENMEFQFKFVDKLNKNNINANKWFNSENILYKKILNNDK